MQRLGKYKGKTIITGDRKTNKVQLTEKELLDILIKQNTPTEIKFYVNGIEYTALEGMTWEEFCDSDYNAGGSSWISEDLFFEIVGSHYVWGSYSNINGAEVKYSDKTSVMSYDKVIAGYDYICLNSQMG